jgi:methylated-DNA-[protein]-cysteine S-methyltransferase
MSSIKRAFLKTPLGFMEITGSEKGVNSIAFLDFKVKVNNVPSSLKPCVTQLQEYFSGERKSFDLDLEFIGTPFQHAVWLEIQKIPYGQTITYHELAKRIGNSKAVRAVGGANGANPLPIVVPCHRVIGHDGRLVGYAGGIKRKKWLLEHEHALAQRDLFYGKF